MACRVLVGMRGAPFSWIAHLASVAVVPGHAQVHRQPADLPIFRRLDNSSRNTAHVRDVHRSIDQNINERRRTHTAEPKDETTRARSLRGGSRPWWWGVPMRHTV